MLRTRTFLLLNHLIYMRKLQESIRMPRRDDMEYKALHFIMNTGSQGVLQSDLWRKLGASSREGSRIALKLENKRLIRRSRELFDGRWTYRLYPKRQQASINSVVDCPCLMCANDARCGAWGAVSPNECERLTEWISGLSSSEVRSSGEG